MAGVTRRSVVSAIAVAGLGLPSSALAVRYVVPSIPPDLDLLRGLALNLPDGSATTLGASVPAGRAAVISFWASWCAPCLLEARHLAYLRARFSAAQLSIVGINVDRTPEEARLVSFIERAGADFTQLRAGRDAYRAFGGPRYIELPRTFVFDRVGRPVGAFGHFDGAVAEAELDDAVLRALG